MRTSQRRDQVGLQTERRVNQVRVVVRVEHLPDRSFRRRPTSTRDRPSWPPAMTAVNCLRTSFITSELKAASSSILPRESASTLSKISILIHRQRPSPMPADEKTDSRCRRQHELTFVVATTVATAGHRRWRPCGSRNRTAVRAPNIAVHIRAPPSPDLRIRLDHRHRRCRRRTASDRLVPAGLAGRRTQ